MGKNKKVKKPVEEEVVVIKNAPEEAKVPEVVPNSQINSSSEQKYSKT